ncbi:polymerase [Mycobacterium kyorinense]|uniref:Polymerase n=1 Tax=Mycobacterium kyorinense TaxID=487514 RepID=A0A1A2Z3N9_9MYCO|nr:O-antigen ligase family protein [Mycobacterium kyorinense]OBI43801.1 polymerase [Mycobacterium kyorinense]
MILYATRRQQLAMTTGMRAAFLFGCFMFGVFSVRNTTQGVLLIGATFCLVLYWTKPEMMGWVALFLGCASLPQGLPPGKVIGPLTIYGHHVPLLLGICYLIPIVRLRLSTFALPLMFLGTVFFFTAAGFATGHAPAAVLHEATLLLEMVGGFVLALLLVYGGYISGTVRVVAVTLWLSAGISVLSSLHVIRLAGRAESLEGTTGAAEATRVITNTLTPAIAVLATLVAAQIVGRVRPGVVLALGPPALLIPLLAFSRNTLIAVGLAAVVAFGTSNSWSALRRTVKLTSISVAIFAVTVPGALFLLQHSTAGAWLGDQFTAFNHRVLGGVSSSALAADSSTQARLAEDANLYRAIGQAPLFGHGLGYAYQQPFGKDPDEFTATLGTTYSHNFYLWWLCKAGAVGMAAFAMFAVVPVVQALRRASAPAKISAAVSIGLLAMCVVDPLPEDPANALTLGMALGSAMAFGMSR